MRGVKTEALIRKHILPHVHGFTVRRDVLFAQPLLYILRGYCFVGDVDPRNQQQFLLKLKHAAKWFGTKHSR